ncbi:hypothetical protein [Pleomorphomonas sp. PLEO]|uniref:hypothetical protein n=1 Tax=Pleomorphomonas sp. PLEO TaxID=3239306 RepID=UPI00351E2B5A
MAHCPYCLTAISERGFVCHACGAEKGYLYFNRQSRGLAFLLMIGFLAPLAAVLAILLYFQGMGMAFWLAVMIALGLGIFTVRRLFTGPIWYR